jgi:hypothetical protein
MYIAPQASTYTYVLATYIRERTVHGRFRLDYENYSVCMGVFSHASFSLQGYVHVNAEYMHGISLTVELHIYFS